jgi:tetratricopeptide (TPR) repeat protein
MATPIKLLSALLLSWLAGCATGGMSSVGDRRVDVDSHVLLGEIAREREQFESAAEHYLAAAQISEDSRWAALATEVAHEIGLDDLGLSAARRWQALDPDDFRAAQFLGVFLLRNGNLDDAITVFEELLATAQNQGAGLALIIELLFGERDEQSVTALVSRLVAGYPEIAEGHYGLGRLALRSGDVEAALESTQRAVALRPQWDQAQLLLARALVLAGRAEEGLALVEGLAADSDEIEVQLQYAELLLSAGHEDAARERLDRILEESPGLPEAIRALAFLTLTQNELEAAKGHFNELRAQPRYRDEAFYYLGRIAESEDDSLQAMRSYSRVTSGSNAVEAQLRAANVLYTRLNDAQGALQHLREFGIANPDFEIEMFVAQSDLLMRMDRDEEAMRLIDDAVAENPESSLLEQAKLQIFLVRAQDAVGRNELGLAEGLLGDALREYPDNVSLRYARALLYQEQGRLRRAATSLEELVADAPDDAGLLNALGYLLTDSMSRHEEAHGYIERALEIEPDNAAIIDSMGWVLFHLGELEAALEHLQRAYELFPDPEVAAHIVDVQFALGMQREARELLQRTLEEHPDSPHLQNARQRIGP